MWVVIDHQARRKSKKVGDRATALRVAQAIRERLVRGEFNLPATDAVTLSQYVETWRRTALGNLKASTKRFYDANFESYILPTLGARLVNSIRRSDCRDLVLTLRAKGLSVSTVRGIARTLSTVLSQAVEDEILPANPALRLGRYLRRGDEPKRQIQVLNRNEVSLFLAVTQTHFGRWYPFLLCALRTGLRVGELVALQWGDLDFAGRFILVQRSFVEGVITTPKIIEPGEWTCPRSSRRSFCAGAGFNVPIGYGWASRLRNGCSRLVLALLWIGRMCITCCSAFCQRPGSDNCASTICVTPLPRC
jgi:integrase